MSSTELSNVLSVDPTKLSLSQLRQLSKSIGAHIKRLESAREALLQSIATGRQAQLDASDGSQISEQSVRAMDLLLSQLHKLHDDSLRAARERRLETLGSVEENMQDSEAKLIAEIEKAQSQGEANAKEYRDLKVLDARRRNREHDQHTYECFLKRLQKQEEMQEEVENRQKVIEERQRQSQAKLRVAMEEKRKRLEEKRTAALQRVLDRERVQTEKRENRAKSSLDVRRGTSIVTGGLVKAVLESGGENVLRDEQQKRIKDSLHASQHHNQSPEARKKSNHSSSFQRLTKPKADIDGNQIERSFAERVKKHQADKKMELQQLIRLHRLKDAEHEERLAERYHQREQDREDILESLKSADERIAVRKRAQSELSMQMSREREEHRQEALRKSASQKLPSIDRWEKRAANIMESVCQALTSDFSILHQKPNSISAPNTAMESAAAPSQGFEAKRKRLL